MVTVLYEHPEWFKPLFVELDRRGVAYEKLDATGLTFNPAAVRVERSLVFNRMSPSAHLRGHAGAIFSTLQYLHYLRDMGVPTVNGYEAFRIEISKAAQLTLLRRLGLRYPRSRVINRPSLALDAAAEIGYPVLIKPNLGGSGAGIRSYETGSELQAALGAGEVTLGIDHTALVQEKLTPRDAHIVRVEVLNDEFLYALRIFPRVETGFNLCPTEASSKPGVRIEAYRPPESVIRDVLSIARAAKLDVAGVEYLVNARDDEVYFYDVNALSNFVTDASKVVGFDPFVNLVEYVLTRTGAVAGVPL